MKVEVIEFPKEDKRALRDVFAKYDIRGVFNLAKVRASSLIDEDYVMRRNAVDFGVPLFMEPKVSLSFSPSRTSSPCIEDTHAFTRRRRRTCHVCAVD